MVFDGRICWIIRLIRFIFFDYSCTEITYNESRLWIIKINWISGVMGERERVNNNAGVDEEINYLRGDFGIEFNAK